MRKFLKLRATLGGLVGAISATAQWWFIPPTVAKELLWEVFSINLSVDTAGFLGTLACGAAGTLMTALAPKQEPAKKDAEP